KSRLLAELREVAAEGDGVTWIEGRCLSFGQALPYGLLADLARSAIGVAASAEEPEIRAALKARLAATLGGDTTRQYAFLGQLLGDAMTELTLRPLSTEDSRELVANLLVIESLPVKVRDFILARAEGNPFFVEEVIRMLIDRGAIVRQADEWVATSAVESVEIP